MAAISPVEPSDSGFRPLAPLLQAIAPVKLDAVRARVAGFDRDELVNRFRSDFARGKRLAALILSDELTIRGVPPCFRHAHLSIADYSINQKFDLLAFDLRWLRRRHAEHVNSVRYGRYRDLFVMSDPAFHRAAEYVFYAGKRPAWKIVASLSLTPTQQWDCHYLRSAPIKKRHAETQSMYETVFKALQEDLRTIRRTKSFTDDDATATLLRRHSLWLCSRMAGASPAETAVRYAQMTGQQITRDIVARQLQKVREILAANRVTASNNV